MLHPNGGSVWLHIPDGWDVFTYAGRVWRLAGSVFVLAEEPPT